jgi:hypothetical protein
VLGSWNETGSGGTVNAGFEWLCAKLVGRREYDHGFKGTQNIPSPGELSAEHTQRGH